MTTKSMPAERIAIYAALPVLQNALRGDLEPDVALKWIEHILLSGLRDGAA